jgi:transcriptional regulator with XRE-family HTH domain
MHSRDGSHSTPFGANLRRLRKDRGLTQEGLAERSKVARTTIARMEGGWYAGARSTTLESLAKALGSTLEGLLTPFIPSKKRSSKSHGVER